MEFKIIAEGIATVLEKYITESGTINYHTTRPEALKLVEELYKEINKPEQEFDDIAALETLRRLYFMVGKIVEEDMIHTHVREQDIWSDYLEIMRKGV